MSPRAARRGLGDAVAFSRTYASALALTAANSYVAFPAVIHSWSLAELMWVYWLQSVIIGLVNAVRMVTVRDVEVGEFQIFGRPAKNTKGTRRLLALMFLAHYGFMHFAVLLLMAFQFDVRPTELDGFVATGVIFMVVHAFAFIRHFPALRRSKPDLGSLMFFPYLRILPMFVTILVGFGLILPPRFGGETMSGALVAVTLLFMLLKTVADVGMHRLEESKVYIAKESTLVA